MGNVRGPYSMEEWKTMKLLKFQSIPRLERKNKEFNGRYQDRLSQETDWLTGYLVKEVA